ncbi:hypothetical protein GCM10023185_23470 [Hymenobacter saemangeumensis]|uniref:PKD domain-containing protein n=2 Tax=Hymenobacter saemangeumensis TaxID=1084522 RepID=A0ABP8IFZ7_9BACT
MALAAPALAQTPAEVTRTYPEHRFGLRCAFDSVQQAAFRRDPGSEARYQSFLREVAQQARNAQGRLLSQPDVTVPVVMHIIHTGGADNISDAQVQDALRIINEDFSKTNRDTASVIPDFQGRYANVGFKFRLAKLDPNGNCTTGITRTYSTDTNIGDDRVKRLITWDQSKYLNIWICTNANGAGGYAYLPCTGGSGDGIVIRAAQFGSIGQAGGGNFAARSLTHEIGHYFGLPHTWGGSNTPGLATNCGLDDGIADTPNTIGASGCNLAFSPCQDASGQQILSNVQNYMDYASCARMFTTGQRAVMRAALQLGCRAQLSTPANLLATGTNDGFMGGPCAPVIVFRPSDSKICEGGTVTFNDYSYNADLQSPGTVYSWSFPGGQPATSSQRNPTVTYPASGQYDVTLAITTAGGNAVVTRSQLVQVVGPNSGLTAPIAESFENPGFPNNFAAPDLRNWVSTSSASTTLAAWQRRAAVAGSLAVSEGSACVALRSNLIPTGTTTWLASPNISLAGFSASNPPVLVFDRAYAQRTTPVAENLQVQFSSDCGVTWTTAASYFSSTLNTMGTLRVDGYTPTDAADWQSLQVAIDPSYIGPRFQLRFQLTSRVGNPIYLDNVRLAMPSGTRAVAEQYGLRVFPNPVTSETAVQLSLPKAGTVQLQLLDLMGRAVLTLPATHLPAGRQTLALPQAAGLSAGVYVVRVQAAGQQLSTKLLVQ